MRKICLALLILIAASACQSATEKQYAANLQRYNAYYTAILNNDKFLGDSGNFDIEVVMNRLSDTEYRYDLIVDNPRIAMYNIEILVIESGKSLEISDQIMPNVGIFEGDEYNMVPYQINLESGFSQGFDLSGTVTKPEVSLKVLVIWHDYAKVLQKREYFDLIAQYSE
ncbi:MAG: hypothetical protein E4G74_03730, partial [Erysipelotrichales bacterium]